MARLWTAGAALESDVYFVSGPINRVAEEHLRRAHASAPHRSRCVLILTTSGGEADSAYRMVRLLRATYERVVVCVFGYCKSAGTLMALGAHEIAMGARGELGPLDVQVVEKDELAQWGFGLEIFTSLSVLRETAFDLFEEYFLTMIQRSVGQISTKTAADIATNLAVGLLVPVFGQVDPVRLGRERRAMDIASEYATRLGVSADIITRLTTAYPDHGFVIDLEEARGFLPQARELSDQESTLEAVMAEAVELYTPHDSPLVLIFPPPASDPIRPNPTETERQNARPGSPQGGVPETPTESTRQASRGDQGIRQERDETTRSSRSLKEAPESARH